MKIVVDTNVLVSAIAFGSARLSITLDRCLSSHHLAITDQIAFEFLRVTAEKAPDKLPDAVAFLSLENLTWLVAGERASGEPAIMRDPSDQPILDAAIASDADIILTGDKDFTLLDIERPRIMSPAEFIAEFL